MIVVVLVVGAAALAFIVLYNLTNINITERQREIATLKVLGFTRAEVDAYIFREIMLLTILGALVGLIFGIVLEGFVVVTAEVDYVMFGRQIHAPSFAVAFALTLVFAAVVMLFMRRKLDKIDMIESLKSLE
jgi:putative ABC transport system permease protein